ncbi:hypothetical protein V8C37DRAFT_176910 [Trichoderma ceciliae]
MEHANSDIVLRNISRAPYYPFVVLVPTSHRSQSTFAIRIPAPRPLFLLAAMAAYREAGEPSRLEMPGHTVTAPIDTRHSLAICGRLYPRGGIVQQQHLFLSFLTPRIEVECTLTGEYTGFITNFAGIQYHLLKSQTSTCPSLAGVALREKANLICLVVICNNTGQEGGKDGIGNCSCCLCMCLDQSRNQVSHPLFQYFPQGLHGVENVCRVRIVNAIECSMYTSHT